MFYHNTKWKFALPEGSPAGIAGGVIAASAMPADQLIRRIRKDIRKFPYLQHRLFDPQLYLAGLDPNVARKPVVNLATYQWFARHDVPQYDSAQHGTLNRWKQVHEQALVDTWRRAPLNDAGEISLAIRAAISHQVALGCRAVILPAPLTTVAAQQYQTETEWIEAGIDACRELRVALPIFATVALSDTLLRGTDPSRHPLLHTITNQIGARDELAGAYIVIEQAGEDGYTCTSRETLLSLLLMVDDLARGGAKQVIINYMGTFGAVATAARAEIWSSGYYLGQRRLKLGDFDDRDIAFAMPRYLSLRLAGDIGLEEHLAAACASGLADALLTPTQVGRPLADAIRAGTYPDAAPQWEHRQGNITAAAAHYNEIAHTLGVAFDALEPERRIEFVHRWLREAAALAERVRACGIQRSHYTELTHQRVWLDTFEEWRNLTGV